MNYDYAKIEAKWHKYWQEHNTFYTDVWDFSKPKYYVLDMFPYPSGVGLHAGHPEGYTATDIVSRMKRMQGYNVLHPMGYDSFGLPAEQYAVNTGHHPNGFTQKNIETFSAQLKELGFDYDWSKMIATSDPSFYKWTQWIFKKLYEAHRDARELVRGAGHRAQQRRGHRRQVRAGRLSRGQEEHDAVGH